MSKNNKNKLVPRLRFPEFKNKYSWARRELSEILFEHKEKSTGKEEVFSVSVHKGVINQIEHLGRAFAANNTDNYKRVLPGDIIYTKSPTGDFPFGIIKQSKVSHPVIVSPLYGVFTPETIDLGVILDAYFQYPENTINYLSSIVQKGPKNTINIKNETFLSKSLILPTDKLEQKKIANCLSSLDEVIAGERQKLALLQQHKKGLLQQLFPQEGETVPRLRFPEFQNAGEWEVKKLGELGEIKNGLNGKSAEDFGEGALFVTYKQVFDSSKIDLSKCGRVRIKEGEKQTSLKKGDILFTTSSETPEEVGFASVVLSDLSEPVFLNSFCFLLRPFSLNQLLPEFSQFLFRSPGFRSSVTELAQGITRFNLSKAQFVKILISFPSLPEQQKIAACLSSLDDLIAAQSQKIELLEQHKKGLLQGLFPKIDDHG